MEFVGQFAGDLGATVAAGNVVLGDRLGLYRGLATGTGHRRASSPRAPAPTPATSPSGCAARRPAATSSTTPTTDSYSMSAEQAFALTDPHGVAVPARARSSSRSARSRPCRGSSDAFRTGAGLGWHEHDERGVHRLREVLPPGLPRPPGRRSGSRPSTASRRSSRRAPGSPTSAAATGPRTILLARGVPARPRSSARTTTPARSRRPRKRAAEAGVDRPRQRSRSPAPRRSPAPATTWSTSFDCLHDMGDPLGAAARTCAARSRPTAPG